MCALMTVGLLFVDDFLRFIVILIQAIWLLFYLRHSMYNELTIIRFFGNVLDSVLDRWFDYFTCVIAQTRSHNFNHD